MCQAFEPATSTQDKSLSTVGFPTRRGESPGRRRLVFFLSLFFFSNFSVFIFLLDFSSCYSDYVTVTSMPFPCCFRFCGILLFSSALERLFEGRRILGYSGRAFDSVTVSRIPGSRVESSNPWTRTADASPGFGSLNLWILEFLEVLRSLDHRVLGS